MDQLFTDEFEAFQGQQPMDEDMQFQPEAVAQQEQLPNQEATSATNVMVATTATPIVVKQKVAAVKSPKKRAPRKKKDPNAPASVTSAYSLFFKDTQATLKAHNPSAKFGDISRIVASMWEALGEAEKAVYKKRNEEDKIRFRREMEAYKAGLGKTEEVAPVETEATADSSAASEATSQVFQTNGVTASLVPEAGSAELAASESRCIREGCPAMAVISPEWEDEYCSNECVVKHCKNVFAQWVSAQ